MYFLFMTLFLMMLVLMLFFFASQKKEADSLMSSVFECGFTSYHFSRFSFSMHYFSIGLIFLFLDLELCYVMPFFNSNSFDMKLMSFVSFFILVLVLGLLEEWKFKALDWKF